MRFKHINLIFLLCVLIGFHVTGYAEDDAVEVDEKVYYYEMEPAFVANYGTSNTKLKFLKATVSLRTVGSKAQGIIFQHNPLVRHEIVMLLSRQTEESLTSQETVRLEALKVVQDALEEVTGDKQVEDLLFTTFIVQR